LLKSVTLWEPVDALTVTKNVLLPVTELLSMTNTVNENGPVAVGVPDNKPALDNPVPVGTAPLLTLQVNGSVPPVAVRL